MFSLFNYITAYKKQFSLSAICHLFTAVFTVVSIPLIIPFFQILFERQVPVVEKPQSTFDIAHQVKYYGANILNNYDKADALLMVCLFIILVFFLKNLFRYLSAYFLIPLRNGIVKDIRAKLFNKYLKLPLSYHDKHSRGDLISRVNNDILEVEWSILSALEVIFKSPLIMLGSLIFMIYISVKLSLFVLVLLLVTVLIIGFLARRLKQESEEVQTGLGRLTSLLEQSLIGVSTIKSYDAIDYMDEKFDEHNQKIYDSVSSLLRRRELSSPLSEFFGVTIVTILLFYGAYLVFDGTLTPETFFAFIFAFYQIIEPAKSFSSAYYNLKKGMAAVDRIEEVLDINTDAKESQLYSFPKDWNQLIFDNVSFKYESQKERSLKALSLKIEKGDKVAIIGPSGSGKSSILKMLLGLYNNYDGQILLDELSLKNIKPTSLYQNLSVVDQASVLLNDSIKANICLGRPYDEKKLIQVIEIANLSEFINDLPKGINHNVGDSGTLISGGEKQRISIARSLYGNPDIILFDEATSALDAKSELKVTQAVASAIEERTALIVAHRLSTLKLANKILLLEDGQIVEYGNLEELKNQSSKIASYINTIETID